MNQSAIQSTLPSAVSLTVPSAVSLTLPSAEKYILFTHAYFLRLDPKQWATGQPYPPLATIGAAALLRENGYRVGLFDTMFVQSGEELRGRLEQDRPRCLVIYDDGFNYLTKMCLTNMREEAFRMIGIAKEMGIVVAVCSSDSTDHYKDYLASGADFVLLGEGEMSLLELAAVICDEGLVPAGSLRAGNMRAVERLRRIAGLVFMDGGALVVTGARAVMRDLDALPIPAWDLVDMAPYRGMWQEKHGMWSLNIGTTRGCPFKCNWCAKPIYGNRYHARSPEHVVKELKWLREMYAFDHVWFCDDIFGLKPGWVARFADLVQAEGLRFSFRIQSRADLLMQENYVAALARAGCTNVWMGAESGSQLILDAMDKGIRVDQIYDATRQLRRHGIRPSFFIQFGYPGETREDIARTIRMINELLPDSLGISVSYPLPGTVFYERVKEQLKQKANWTDSDELKLMFRNTYPPAFYKQLHRYVHRVYRSHLAMAQIMSFVKGGSRVTGVALKRAASVAWYAPAAFLAGRQLKKLEKWESFNY